MAYTVTGTTVYKDVNGILITENGLPVKVKAEAQKISCIREIAKIVDAEGHPADYTTIECIANHKQEVIDILTLIT